MTSPTPEQVAAARARLDEIASYDPESGLYLLKVEEARTLKALMDDGNGSRCSRADLGQQECAMGNAGKLRDAICKVRDWSLNEDGACMERFFGAHELAIICKAAEAPRVPAVTDHAAIDDLIMKMYGDGYGMSRDMLSALLRIMHEPKRPATKEIEIEQWAVLDGEHLAVVFHSENVARKWATPACGKYTVVRLTGKAQVPA